MDEICGFHAASLTREIRRFHQHCGFKPFRHSAVSGRWLHAGACGFTWAELSGEKDFSSNRGLICITVAHGCEEVGTAAFDLVSQLFLRAAHRFDEELERRLRLLVPRAAAAEVLLDEVCH